MEPHSSGGRDSCLPGLLGADAGLARPPPWAPSLDPVVPLPAWGPSEQSPAVRPELFTHTLASSLLEPFLQPGRDTALLPAGSLPGLQREGRAGTQASAGLNGAPLLAHCLWCPRSPTSQVPSGPTQEALRRFWAFSPREQTAGGADLALTSTRSPGTGRGAEAASEGSPLDCRPLRAHLPPSLPGPYLEFR